MNHGYLPDIKHVLFSHSDSLRLLAFQGKMSTIQKGAVSMKGRLHNYGGHFEYGTFMQSTTTFLSLLQTSSDLYVGECITPFFLRVPLRVGAGVLSPD